MVHETEQYFESVASYEAHELFNENVISNVIFIGDLYWNPKSEPYKIYLIDSTFSMLKVYGRITNKTQYKPTYYDTSEELITDIMNIFQYNQDAKLNLNEVCFKH